MTRDICAMPGCVLPAGHLEHGHPCWIPVAHQDLGSQLQGLARLINHRFDLLEEHVSTVAGTEAQALTDLTAAVDALTANLGTLPQALADAQAALAAAQAADVADKAALDQAHADLAAALDQAQQASDSIESQVARIQSVTPAPAAAPVETVNAGEHDPAVAQQVITPAGGDTPAQVAPIPDPVTPDEQAAADAEQS